MEEELSSAHVTEKFASYRKKLEGAPALFQQYQPLIQKILRLVEEEERVSKDTELSEEVQYRVVWLWHQLLSMSLGKKIQAVTPYEWEDLADLMELAPDAAYS